MTIRYALSNEDLKNSAMNLQLGSGIADRLNTVDADKFLEEAEDWAEAQVDEYMGVPLRPVRAPGESALPTTLSSRNYPHHFIQSALYRALGRLLTSEFFENAPNKSESAQVCFELSNEHIKMFKDKRTTKVGAGRIRHVNPHMPPGIAPRSQVQDNSGAPGV